MISIRDRIPLLLPLLAGVALVVALPGCGPSVAEGNAIQRGDVAYAQGDLEEALAEYRLALRQGSDNAEALARVGHLFALMGRVDDSADHYERAAALDESYADQGVADLVSLARRSAERNDLFALSSAMRRVLDLRPGVSVEELALPLARHYSRTGEHGTALPFYRKALASGAVEAQQEVLYETAVAYEELGDCSRALVFFERARDVTPRAQRGEVDWHIGTCSYRYAQELRAEGEDEEALRHLERTLELGEPRNLLAGVWFEKGELLADLGDCPGAVEAFREVTRVDPGGATPLVSRAEQRIDELRFGEGGIFGRRGGGC